MRRALALLLAVAALVVAYDNGVGRTPPMGWNTWCTDDACGLLDLCFEDEILSVAKAMVSQGLDKLGYTYITLDDCWSDTARSASGQLQPDPTRFPSGMASLADQIHSLGLKLGLYTCVGSTTCRRGRPGSWGHYTQDAETLSGWGVDFVKSDNCARPSGVPDQELYANFSAALNATGRPILFSLCNWGENNVSQWGGDIGQMYRIQMDHLPFWAWPPLAAGAGFGQGTAEIIEFIATLRPSTFVRPYGWMDPDFAETLFPLTMNFIDSRTEFSFWTMWSAPLLIATDLRDLSTEKASIVANSEVIAIDQDPLFVAADRISGTSESGQLWMRPLANGDHAVLMYNPLPIANARINVTWTQLGLPLSANLTVRDLWLHENVYSGPNGWSAEVGAHDVAYLRISQSS